MVKILIFKFLWPICSTLMFQRMHTGITLTQSKDLLLRPMKISLLEIKFTILTDKSATIDSSSTTPSSC
jgi:hypothetical protein